MVKVFCWLLFYGLCAYSGRAQDSLRSGDSLKLLDEVVIQAYEHAQAQMWAAMPIAVLQAKELEDYAPQSAVQAINSIPGVHMEERSPSSYRLNIRGSAMRAPFGVRNVKTYYYDLPYTDPGGTTYLNQLGLLHFADAEIVKGPGGSMYGAGTGGVVLLGPGIAPVTGFKAAYSLGSYGQQVFWADLNWVKGNTTQQVSYQQSNSKGYRQQSAADKKIFSWTSTYEINEKQQIQTAFMLGDLHYETPGALILAEYEKDPAAARPAAGSFPSATTARAAIEQQMGWAGINIETKLGGGLRNKTGLYAAYSELRNPAIRNYAFTTQPHAGLRSVFSLERHLKEVLLRIDVGLEGQSGTSAIDVRENDKGKPGMLRSSENVKAMQGFVFVQGSFAYKTWELQLGASLNTTKIDYNRMFPSPVVSWQRSFGHNLMPRVALSHRLKGNAFAWASFSKGFSPPVTDELLPSGSALNTTLQPEEGQNYEAGLRYRIPGRLLLEGSVYYFRLNHTIVQRRDAGGGDTYINAGSTRQPGVEVNAIYEHGSAGIWTYSVSFNYAYQPYRYAHFIREQDDYSGKALPGLAVHNVYAGAHLELLRHYLFQANYYYNSALPLNDANSVHGKAVHLVSVKAGARFKAGKYAFKAYAGADNLLGQQYSAGYDINAAGGRYYNAAPLRNYYIQLLLERS